MTTSILTADDPAPVSVINRSALQRSPFLLICDHASNVIPQSLGQLGLNDTRVLKEHVAIDIGARDITAYLADKMDVPAVVAGFSRLVIDVNRDPDHDKSIPAISDNIHVPGNHSLNTQDSNARISEIYAPYHRCIAECIDTIKARNVTPFVISIHSFTPEMKGEERLTDIGVLWDSNREIAQKMIADLRKHHKDMVIGSNDPYSFLDAPELNHTLHKHGINNQENYLLMEFRQDLVDTKEKAEKMAEVFLKSLNRVLN